MVNTTRRQFLKAAAAIAGGAVLPTLSCRKETEQVPLEFQLGTPSIGLGVDFSPANARQYLDWYVENGLIEKDAPKQILEVLAAPGPDVDLGDRTNKSFLKAFDGLNELFAEYNIEPVVLAFFPNGCGANMVSNDLKKRTLAEDYLKSCVDIGKKIGAKRVMGPFAVEHQTFNDPYDILNAAPHLLAASEYAGDDFKLAFEVLRKEESVLNKAKDAIRLIQEVKRLGKEKSIETNNVGLQGDICHAMAEGYRDLTEYIEDVKGVLMYLHLSRYEEWGTANNRGQLTETDPVGSQLQSVYETLLKHNIKVPTTVEVPHYAFKDALGRNAPELEGKTINFLNERAKIETLNSYKLAIQSQRAAIQARRAA